MTAIQTPQDWCKADAATIIAETQQTVFTPSVGSSPSLIMRKVAPTILILRIVFADRPPLPFRQKDAPTFPWVRRPSVLPQPERFRIDCRPPYFRAHGSPLFVLVVKRRYVMGEMVADK